MTNEQFKRVKELVNLLQNVIEPTDLKTVEIIKVYEDDHLPCVEMLVNGILVEFLWYDDPTEILNWTDHKEEFIDILRDCVSRDIENLCEDCVTD